MRLEDIHENQFMYEVGDTVETPFGPAMIEDFIEETNKDTFYAVRVLNPEEYDLEDKPYRMGSFEFKGIIKKGE